jgi:hypothetical protein
MVPVLVELALELAPRLVDMANDAGELACLAETCQTPKNTAAYCQTYPIRPSHAMLVGPSADA